ncbi:MAG: response regulator [Halolamina sp.]
MSNSNPSVLVVDDEPSVAEAYSLWLDGKYDVETAFDGREALEKVDESTDVVLLDRRMPDVSGDEALEAIREAGYNCRVAMVTAVDPDFDIVDMPFDSYLTKPVTRDDVIEAIDELLKIDEYEDAVKERFAIAKKRAALENEKSVTELDRSEEYTELREAASELPDADDVELDHDAFAKTLSELDSDDTETVF